MIAMLHLETPHTLDLDPFGRWGTAGSQVEPTNLTGEVHFKVNCGAGRPESTPGEQAFSVVLNTAGMFPFFGGLLYLASLYRILHT